MFYKLPLSFDNLFNNKSLETCSLGESIAQHLQLITETRYGEHQGDMKFGCEIWDFDFELIVKKEDYEQKLQKSLTETIEKYELRLKDIEVEIKISDEEVLNNTSGTREMKKQATIIVRAKIKENSDPFYFKTVFHLNPIIEA